jgi:hypothetical protein
VTFPEVKLVTPLSFAAGIPAAGVAAASGLWARGGARRTLAPMRHRAREVATRAVPAVALALVAGAAAAGCAAAAGGAPGAATRPTATTRATAPVDGPAVPDPACAAAENAEQTLQSRQGQDQNNESALDQDYTNFAAALSAAAQKEKSQAAAQAMTTLANDYTDFVESQSGAAQLPSLSQIQKDGAAFDKACSP